MYNKIDPIATIVASFPIPELTKFGNTNQEPTYNTLLQVQKELNTNSASVETTHGTGLHGLLVLTMANTDFLAMTANIPHPPPNHPGVLAPDATAAAARTYDLNTFHYQQFHSTDKAMKKLILAACPDLYLSALKKSHDRILLHHHSTNAHTPLGLLR